MPSSSLEHYHGITIYYKQRNSLAYKNRIRSDSSTAKSNLNKRQNKKATTISW